MSVYTDACTVEVPSLPSQRKYFPATMVLELISLPHAAIPLRSKDSHNEMIRPDPYIYRGKWCRKYFKSRTAERSISDPTYSSPTAQRLTHSDPDPN